jgi:Flp pilus assembly protein TadD
MGLILVTMSLHAGCAYLPGRETFSRLGLPSPNSTIAASDTSRAPSNSGFGSWFTRKNSPPKTEAQATVGMDIARARNYEQSGNYDKARKIYEDVRHREPNNVEAAYRMGIVADLQKRHGEAEQLFLFALSKKPGDAEIMCDLGYCQFLQGSLSKAETTLRQAVVIAPTNNRAHNNLGLVLGHEGKYEEALEQFAQAGNEADAYFNLAFVYAAQENPKDAKECFRRCLQLDSSHEQARDALVSFDEFDRLTPAMREALVDDVDYKDGVRYVPYEQVVHGGDQINSAVRQASAVSGVTNSRSAAASAQSLHQLSRGMLNRNMASNRPSPGDSEMTPGGN